MYKIIFSKVADYKPINMYFFIRIVRGFASFGRPIFQNSSEWLLLLFANQLFKSDLFRQTVCVFILVNISNIINTSLCNAVYYKETVHSICLLHHLVGFYIITSTATWRVRTMKRKCHESHQVKLPKRQSQISRSNRRKSGGVAKKSF